MAKHDHDDLISKTPASLPRDPGPAGFFAKQNVDAAVRDGTALDVANEAERTYHFPDGSTYRIMLPLRLSIKRTDRGDSHRLVDESGQYHYVRPSWIAISWRAREGFVADDF